MNRIVLILATLIGVVAMLIFYYRWDFGKNRGYTTGYYGEFNTVSNGLANISGITILNSWYNADVTLEEFGFDVKTSEGRTLNIYFGETTPVRKLTGDKLNAALLKRIQEALATQTNNAAEQVITPPTSSRT